MIRPTPVALACAAVLCALMFFSRLYGQEAASHGSHQPAASAGSPPALDTTRIDELTGAKGALNKEENVYKVSFPRTDVKVTVDNTELPPFMGLTSWAGFAPGGPQPCMVMGDIVLFEDEVNPAMSAALNSGLDVTALHNHFFFDTPRVYFMHIGGEGKTETLATGVRKVMDAIHDVRAKNAQPGKAFSHAPLAARSAITVKPIEDVLGAKAAVSNGMAKVTLGRTTQMPCGCTAGKEMGVNTWAAFYGTDEHALVDGDFAVYPGELQGVLKALRAAEVNIVAIHSHMETETPRVIFLHYWGIGPADKLARAVKAALDTQKK